MKMNMTFKEKLQVCKALLFVSRYDNMLVEHCIYCNSLNVRKQQQETRHIKREDLVDLTIWEAQYKCSNCGGMCHVKEIWNK